MPDYICIQRKGYFWTLLDENSIKQTRLNFRTVYKRNENRTRFPSIRWNFLILKHQSKLVYLNLDTRVYHGGFYNKEWYQADSLYSNFRLVIWHHDFFLTFIIQNSQVLHFRVIKLSNWVWPREEILYGPLHSVLCDPICGQKWSSVAWDFIVFSMTINIWLLQVFNISLFIKYLNMPVTLSWLSWTLMEENYSLLEYLTVTFFGANDRSSSYKYCA